jgi:HEAT repeat protein
MTDFEDTLEWLAGDQAIKPSRLYALSNPTHSDTAIFTEAWFCMPAARRRAVVGWLVELSEEHVHLDFRPLLRVLLDDDDAVVRARAIDGLWEDDSPGLARRYANILATDSAEGVRAAAAQALGKYVLKDELGQLDHDLGTRIRVALMDVASDESENLEVRRRAVESVGYAEGSDVKELIRRAYAAEQPSMRASAMFAMGRSADHSWDETVLEELSSPDPAMRYEAARAAGELEIGLAVPRLGEMALEADREVQSMAIWALGRIGGRRAQRVLEGIRDGDDRISAEAAEEALEELVFSSGFEDLGDWLARG